MKTRRRAGIAALVLLLTAVGCASMGGGGTPVVEVRVPPEMVDGPLLTVHSEGFSISAPGPEWIWYERRDGHEARAYVCRRGTDEYFATPGRDLPLEPVHDAGASKDYENSCHRERFSPEGFFDAVCPLRKPGPTRWVAQSVRAAGPGRLLWITAELPSAAVPEEFRRFAGSFKRLE